MPVGLQLLQAARLTTMVQALEDPRLLPQQLKFLARTPDTPSWDGEIMARDIARVQIADLIADDQRSAIYSSGKLSFESYPVPNLKLGIHFTQEQINQLLALSRTNTPQDATSLYGGSMQSIVQDRVERLSLGIKQRKEALIIAMQLDSLNYDRLGMKVTATWGMPTDLKVTLTGTNTWTSANFADTTNCDPIRDILTQLRLGQTRYGEFWNRLTMSTQCFINMTSCVSFQNRARTVMVQYGGYSVSTLPVQSTQYMKGIAEALTGMSIELYDARYWQQNPDGTVVSTPFFPLNVVLFSSTADDNNASVMDFANSIVTESVVADLVGTMPSLVGGGLGGAQRGPVAYATASPALDPPNFTLYAVARGFPRKKRLQATSTLTVGTITDTIPVGEPF